MPETISTEFPKSKRKISFDLPPDKVRDEGFQVYANPESKRPRRPPKKEKNRKKEKKSFFQKLQTQY